MTTLRVHWGAMIRARREAEGLSLNALAQKAGVDPSNLSKIERGLVGVSDEMKTRLAGALGRPVGELFPFPNGGPKR